MPDPNASIPTILLVEDDPDDRMLFRDYLEEGGRKSPRLRAVDTPDQALRELSSTRFDACYVDYRLGAESGLDFIRRARELHPAVPFILLTGQPEEIDGEALAAGARDFMRKPELSSERLLRSVRYVVNQTRNETAIRDQRTIVNGLLHSLGEVLWIRDADDGEYLEVGPGVEALTGLRPEDFLRDASLWTGLVDPEDRERRERLLRDAASDRLHELEYILHDAKDARHLVRERIHRMRNTAGSDWVVGISRDVTGERESLSRLRLYQQVVEEVDDVILVTDNQLEAPGGPHILYVNPAFTRMTGYRLEEVMGESPALLQGPNTDRELLKRMRAALLRGEDFVAETSNYRKDGSEYIVQWSISPIREASGDIQYYASIQRDVTEERRRQEERQRDQRLESLGTLVGGVAHDLNNLLSPILMGAELLRETGKGENGADIAESIIQSSRRAAGVAGQLLAFARGGGHRRQYVELAGVVEETYRIARETFPKHIDLRTNIEENLWPAHVNPDEIQQVLLNLTLNARDSLEGRESGRIRLSVESRSVNAAEAETVVGLKPGDYTVLQVEDNGSGIPRQHLDKIFDPFFTTKPKGKGTGLGLSSCIGIVRAHGGCMDVDSEVGEGTCFTLYLPAHPEERGKGKDPESGISPRGEGQRVLVVDDEATICELASDMLNHYGYHARGFTDAREALKFLRKNPEGIDLLLTDVMMPDLDGVDLVREVRSLRPDLPILAMSGYVRHEKFEELGELGVEEVLSKPVTQEDLMRAVHRRLHRE